MIILALEALDDFVAASKIYPSTRIILGDFNVVSSSPVCEHLRKSGFTSCLEICPPSNGSGSTTVDSFVSHRTHRKEDLGVDHIFVRHDHVFRNRPSNADEHNMHVFVKESIVLPESLDCSAWNESFVVSDHRPVSATIMLTQRKQN